MTRIFGLTYIATTVIGVLLHVIHRKILPMKIFDRVHSSLVIQLYNYIDFLHRQNSRENCRYTKTKGKN